MKRILTSILLATALTASADGLKGFEYGSVSAPDGTEWQSPERLSLNKLQPTAYLFHFAREAAARRVLPQNSVYYQSLDGTWKFRWVGNPWERDSTFHQPGFDTSAWDDIQVPGCWNVQGLRKDGSMKYGAPIYVNQPVIFQHRVAVDDWRGGVMRTPPTDWTTYKDRNEVGSYLRRFTVPADWKGRQVLINFDGVDSFFYLWINGKYVGFSKNSRNTASFDITPYLDPKGGENTVAVEVYRNSDASFLESQDMFRLPGIFRSTYLTSRPQLHVSDLVVRTAVINGDKAEIDIQGTATGEGTIEYAVYPVELYKDQTGEQVAQASLPFSTIVSSRISVPNANLWSAEAPHRYVLTATLKDKKGKVQDIVSTYFGVRTVQIRETKAEEDEFGLAGRYFYVNDKPVKLKGVNRHENNPELGHAITKEQMREEVMIMKRGNINHVRLSHYSNDPYFYYLADKYGLYLEDECNLESHQYYYGDASLSHPKEWLAAHIARNMEMVHGHVNHPSIVIWSLGNEAGPGDNFKAAYEAIRQFDQSRPVQYERNNNIVDMGSNQYPSVDWVRWVAKGKANVKYPFHISEYAHSMGNSLGNLVDYWEAMESTNYFCGAAIWDWCDQAILTYNKYGKPYMGYGGDHNDWPNDGMFCMNGILLPDLSPKPQYYEVKKVYQNVGVTLDSVWTKGNILMAKGEVFNKNYFTTLDAYDVNIQILCDGKVIAEKQAPLPSIAPRQHFPVTLPLKLDSKQDGELMANIQFRLKEDMPWAKKGYVQMDEQLVLNTEFTRQPLENGNAKTIEVQQRDGKTKVFSGAADGLCVEFNDCDGSINLLEYGTTKYITPGNGPRLDAYRAPVDNDNWAWQQWYQQGLYKLEHKALGAPIVEKNADGSVTIVYTVKSQAPTTGSFIRERRAYDAPFGHFQDGEGQPTLYFTTTQRYTIHKDAVSVAASIVSSESSIVLPRLGYVMLMDKQFDQFAYYGRGPLNNYADRKTGSFFGLYESTVQDQFVNFPKPQSMGNREEVRWAAVTNPQGRGLQFIADRQPLSVSALPWSAQEMTVAAHPHELPESDGTWLHLDCQVTGLGGNSCGQGGPLVQDRVQGSLHQMHFIIRPVSKNADLTATSKVKDETRCPVSISRDRAGKVTIQGDQTLATPVAICYQVTEPGQKKPGKVQRSAADASVAELSLRQGGTVTAWYEGEDAIRTSATYERIENVPVEVVYVSSEETNEGGQAKHIVDGDPSTIWHTMYSVTVTKFPHWIDFDCNETKLIKGFTYLPRQNGSNGDIKDYKVEVSADNKTWKPAAEGQFSADKKEKRVLFVQPQKARYIRFTALSAHNGLDFASGAEFTVIAE